MLPTPKLIEIWRAVSKKHTCKANIPVSEHCMLFRLGRLPSSSASISLEKQQSLLVHCTCIQFRTKVSAGTPIYLSYV